MPENTVRVSDPVHDELRKRKREYDAESYDEVLKRELGIIPDPNELGKLTAYLDRELQSVAREIIELIRGRADFTERVDEPEYSNHYQLVFTDTESGYDVAYIDFGDDRFDYAYLDTKRKWKEAAAATHSRHEDKLRLGASGRSTYDHVEFDHVKETVQRTVDGALQRWRK